MDGLKFLPVYAIVKGICERKELEKEKEKVRCLFSIPSLARMGCSDGFLLQKLPEREMEKQQDKRREDYFMCLMYEARIDK